MFGKMQREIPNFNFDVAKSVIKINIENMSSIGVFRQIFNANVMNFVIYSKKEGTMQYFQG